MLLAAWNSAARNARYPHIPAGGAIGGSDFVRFSRISGDASFESSENARIPHISGLALESVADVHRTGPSTPDADDGRDGATLAHGRSPLRLPVVRLRVAPSAALESIEPARTGANRATEHEEKETCKA